MGAGCSSQNDPVQRPIAASLAPLFAFDGPKLISSCEWLRQCCDFLRFLRRRVTESCRELQPELQKCVRHFRDLCKYHHMSYCLHKRDAAVGGYDHGWKNYFEDVMIIQLGDIEYHNRRKTQDELFMKGAQVGGVVDKIELKMDTTIFNCMFGKSTKETGQRAVHPKGIGMSGYARVDPDPSIPKSDLFKAGRLYEVRARHSTFPSSEDHTIFCIPSLSVKFADLDEGGPLDLICLSGRCSNFFNSNSIRDQATMNNGAAGAREYMMKLPVYLAAMIENGRLLPDSFYHIYYHAHTVFHFTPNDGNLRLARFRIVPADGSRESGRLTKEEQMRGEAWNSESRADGQLTQTYLYDELKNRMADNTILYQVQIQLYEPPNGKLINHHMYNASIPWKESKVPWRNLMTLHFSSILPAHVTEVTKFCIGNTSNPISIPGCSSDDDFNAIPNIRKTVYKTTGGLRSKEAKDFDKDAIKFKITIETGSKKGSGTDAEIRISLIGAAGRTSFRKINKLGVNDFERKSSRSYNITDMDIGELLCAKLSTKPEGILADWFVDNLHVQYKSNGKDCHYLLPCYRWFTDKVRSITMTDGKGKLPQHEEHPYMILQRSLMVQDQETMYSWRQKSAHPVLEKFPGFSIAGDDSEALPRDMRFDDEKEQLVAWRGLIGSVNAVSGKIRDAILDAFKKDRDPFKAKGILLTELIDKSVTLKYIMEHWAEDEEFGRQFLQGMNTVKIFRLETLPKHFPVTNDMVNEQLDDGKTLQDEIQAKKVYMVSYPELDAYSIYQSGQKRYMCAPMCLFYVKKNRLIPIAIQLSQIPGNKAPIFTKKDDKADKGNTSDWLLAKMWVKVADTNYQQLSVHLMGTHLVIEPFAIATMRNFPSMHPVYKLLVPHILFTVAINTFGRKVLIPDGTIFSHTLAMASRPGEHIRYMIDYYQNHLCLDAMDICKDLETRGVKDENDLPGYFFRDDALSMWKAIQDFVTLVLGQYYKEDADVLNDIEMQSFLKDLRKNGFHSHFGLPNPMDTKEKLMVLITIIIYRASCGHASANFGQLDQFGFTPNSPGYMMSPPPTAKNPNGIRPEDMQKILPLDQSSSLAIALANILSKFSDDERFLGDYPEQHFTEKEPQDAIKLFQDNLKNIADSINKRNKNLPVPYNYLNPEQVPNSIAI